MSLELKVVVDDEQFDKLVIESLTECYYTIKGLSYIDENDKKNAKALKRVIKYYGGSVDDN